MRVVSLGNHALPWATEAHLARDAEALGHQVVRVQEPNGGDYRWFAELERAATDADLLIYTKTYGLPAAAPDVWRRLEARGTRTASFHLDLYVGLPRQKQVGRDPFWQTGTVFTADGDPNTQQFMAGRGVNHRWLPPAVVSDETAPGQWDDRYDYDVVFVGSRTYHPAWPWRSTLVDRLAERYGTRFGWFNTPQIRGGNLNDLYATARIAVGDSLCLPGHRNYWSDRYFETIGRGGFLIAPSVPGLEHYLTANRHFVAYRRHDIQLVFDLIDDALDNTVGREQIAKEGHAHVAEHHTYRQRFAEIARVVGTG